MVVENCHGNDGNGNGGSRYSVGMHEGAWRRADRPGEPVNREQMIIVQIIQLSK